MTENEMGKINEFATSISRELGAVDSRLTSIEQMIFRQHDETKAMWIKFDERKDAVDKKFSVTKMAIESANKKIVYFTGALGGIMFVLTIINVFGKYFVK